MHDSFPILPNTSVCVLPQTAKEVSKMFFSHCTLFSYLTRLSSLMIDRLRTKSSISIVFCRVSKAGMTAAAKRRAFLRSQLLSNGL